MDIKIKSRDVQTVFSQYPAYVLEVQKNYRRNFLLFILEASAFTVSLAFFSEDTVLPLLISNLTRRSIYIGIIPAIFYLGAYIPQIFGAYLVHGRQTRKGVVFWITIVQRFATLFLALVVQSIRSVPDSLVLILFLIVYAAFALTNGMIRPPYMDLINKTIINRRGVFYGTQAAITGIIGFGASLLAKYLLDHYPFPVSFKLMFWIAFGISFASPFIVAAFREVPYPEVQVAQKFQEYFHDLPAILRTYPKYVRYLTARLFVGSAFMANAFYAVYAIQRYDLAPGTIGLFAMFILVSKSLTGFIWGWVGDRYGYKLVMLGVGFSLALEAFIALSATGPLYYFLIAALMGSVMSATWINDPNMIFEMAPPTETSRFIGLTNSLIGPVMVLVPILGGAVVDMFSYQALFGFSLVMAVIGFLTTLLRVEEPRKERG